MESLLVLGRIAVYHETEWYQNRVALEAIECCLGGMSVANQ